MLTVLAGAYIERRRERSEETMRPINPRMAYAIVAVLLVGSLLLGTAGAALGSLMAPS